MSCWSLLLPSSELPSSSSSHPMAFHPLLGGILSDVLLEPPPPIVGAALIVVIAPHGIPSPSGRHSFRCPAGASSSHRRSCPHRRHRTPWHSIPFWAAFFPMSCWSLLLPSSELPSSSSSHPMAFPSPAQNSSTVIPAEQA